MVETAIFSQRLHREYSKPYYARWKEGEVDLVNLDDKDQKPNWAAEIKWSNSIYTHSKFELKNLVNFAQKNGIRNVLATTIDVLDEIKLGDVSIQFIPASVYAYNVGYATIVQQYNKMI
jgi:hypothetical protein